MKKIIISLFLTAVLTLTACSQTNKNIEPEKPADYSKIYEFAKAAAANRAKLYAEYRNTVDLYEDDMVLEDGAVPETTAAAADPAPAATAVETTSVNIGDGADYSDTNNQVDGVQEGDIVKTDGKYIYILSGQQSAVNIVMTAGLHTELVKTVKKENAYPYELLLSGGKLIIIWNGNVETKQDFWESEMIVEVYELGSFDKPLSSYSQMGYYVSSRVIDGYMYLVTGYSPYYLYTDQEFGEDDLDCYVPSYTVNGLARFIEPASIILPEEQTDYIQYTTVAGLNLNDKDLLVSTVSDMSGGSIVYSSPENIYVSSVKGGWWNYGNGNGDIETTVNKFSLGKGNVEFVASASVNGGINNQFWMDEYKGALRVVSQITRWSENSNYTAGVLSAFDENMNKLSEIAGIGEGESVQSVRFDRETAYIVTFLQKDPLFAFDMSDPKNPVKKDELKIPGYSRYLHKWADGLLLGIGVNADGDGARTGLKLSMFGVTDNQELSELDTYTIDMAEQGWIYTEAEYNHKAILVSPERNIIAFPYTYYSYGDDKNIDYQNRHKYAVFSYENGFKLLGEIEYTSKTSPLSSYWSPGFIRGLYIDGYLYAIAENKVISANLSDFSETEELILFNYEDIYAQYPEATATADTAADETDATDGYDPVMTAEASDTADTSGPDTSKPADTSEPAEATEPAETSEE